MNQIHVNDTISKKVYRKGGMNVRCGFALSCLCLLLSVSSVSHGCTVIVAGRDATVDGSVITSQTADGWYDSNLRYVPGGEHLSGDTAPVYLHLLGEDDRKPQKIGEIPQVPMTYGYFKTGYSSYNQHQLAIAESTIGQRDELKAFWPESRAIMTIEQLEIFALQRAKTAREAILLMGSLAEAYGFLGSCSNEGESLAVADPKEAWIFEIMSVGFDWVPESGRPGAIWVAKRVPDDHVAVLANASRIDFVDPTDGENFMSSENYMEPAIRNGWYDPASGVPFSWRDAYSPDTGLWTPSSMWIRGRFYCILNDLVPSGNWDPYGELRSYPFSFVPEKKVSVPVVINLLRSTHEGTVFSMEDNQAWLVPGVNGELRKSELATPLPERATRVLLNIPYARPIAAKSSWSFVSQSRSWLPDEIGGVLWVGLGLPHFSCYVPVYAGSRDTADSWRNFDPDVFDHLSMRWCVSLAGDLVNRLYQRAMKDLLAVRGPIEEDFFGSQPEVEAEALDLYSSSPEECSQFLTALTLSRMDMVHKTYWQLCRELIAKYSGIKLW
ncbi:MAG: peptidase [Synergistales bacterium]|nr:peptidase [Synergistales bacterium]